MEIAITGAGGYLGSALMRRHLARGDAVRIMLRHPGQPAVDPRLRVFHGDISHPDTVPAAFLEGSDVLYHCAAELAREDLMQAVNVEGTRALAERARGRVRHWVQVSTVAVYGRPREGVISEESPLNPNPGDRYASTKAEADRAVVDASRGEFTHTVLRPSYAFGPGMSNPALYNLISVLAAGRFFFVGRPGAMVNCVHEENVLHALLLCATLPQARQRTYNLSEDCTLDHLIAALARALGKPVPGLRIPEPLARMAAGLSRVLPSLPLTPARVDTLTSRVRYPAARIMEELGYRCIKPLEDALVELVQTWRGRMK